MTVVSIIIPTYNKLGLLQKCVESIRTYTTIGRYEIIVVSNGCKDGTVEWLKKQSDIKSILCEHPVGFSHANNLGIKIATGGYIVLLNNDTELLGQNKDQWIDLLLEPFTDPATGITGPLMSWCPYAQAEFLIFFCVMIKRELLDKIGTLDEIFGVGGGEDVDLCIRAREAGYKVRQVPPGQLKHGVSMMVGSFPIYHHGEGTLNDTKLIGDWPSLRTKNQMILRNRWDERWILCNYWERAVIGAKDPVPPREHARYEFAGKNILGNSVLELGCSSGYGTRYIDSKISYLGIDKDEPIIRYARKQFPKREFEIGDVNEYRMADTIIAFEILEHLENGKELAQELKKRCKCLMATVPYNEIPGTWGCHHKIFHLTEKDFPGFEFKFITDEGVADKPKTGPQDLSLLLMKWTA